MNAQPALEARIADRYPTLAPQERRAADTLLEHLGDVGTYRATELAELAGVTTAGAFGSHATAMSLVALISGRVLAQLPGADSRIDRVDHSYRQLHDVGDA